MRYGYAWILLAAAGLAGGVAAWGEASGSAGEVYRPENSQWSKHSKTESPSGKHTFLGPFGCESTVLSLDNLPEHVRVRVSFDLMVILTWDGDANQENPQPTGPDLFDVTVDGGPRLVHASFTARPSSSSNITQSFPGWFPYDHLPPGTGATESRTLGYLWGGAIGDGPDDYVYHVERTFGHSEKSLKIAFSGINLEPNENELWGLENVRVEILPARAGGKFDEAAFGKSWGDLGTDDPKRYVPAVDGMIDMGDAAVAAIRRLLVPRMEGAGDDAAIARLIGQLDDDDYARRERAQAALKETGAAAEGALRTALEKASPEARERIRTLLESIEGGEVASEAGRRMRRLVEVLELIGTQEARAGLGEIAGQSGTLAAWEAKGALERLAGKAQIPTKLDLPPGLPKRGVALSD